MRFFKGLALLLAVGVAQVGCKKSSTTDDSSISPTPSAVAAAVASAKSAIVSSDPVKYSAPVTSSSIVETMAAPSVHTFSTTNMTDAWFQAIDSNIVNLYCGGSGCGGAGQPSNTSSPKKWLNNMLDKNFTNSNSASVGLMGRLQSALTMPCVVGQIMGGSALPAAGTQTVTVTTGNLADANTVCGASLSLNGQASFSSTVVVTDVSGTNGGMFDRHMSLTTPSGGTQDLYLKVGSVIRIMSVESYTSTGGYPQADRYYIDLDTTTQVGRFEGFERGFVNTNGQNGGFYFYRLWTNLNTKEVRILGANGGVSQAMGSVSLSSNEVVVGGAGNFNQALATFQIQTPQAGAPEDFTGCLDMNAGTVSSGGVCSGTGRSFDLNTAADALINTTVFNKNTVGAWTLNESVSTLTFDDTTIFSAAPAN